MKQQPLVSVIIPTYKRSDTLPRAIDSVLGQTYPNIEIIVVDDNGEGTDYQKATEERLREYIASGKITYIKHPVNKNGSAARNTGFSASKGEYINFLDDDDYFKKDNVCIKVNALQESSDDIGGAFSTVTYTYINRNGKWVDRDFYYEKDGDVLKDFLIGKAVFNTSGVLFKKKAILCINGFDESFIRHQDYEFIIRFFRSFQLINASSSPLYYMDVTSSGAHARVIADRLKFERNFIRQFKADLVNHNCYHSFCHYIYYHTCISYIGSGDIKKILLTFFYSLRHGVFSISEIGGLIRKIVKTIIDYAKC